MATLPLWLKHVLQNVEFERQTARIALEVGDNAPLLRGATAGDDKRRGVPIQARGVPGTSAGSRPDSDGALDRMDRERERMEVA